MDRGENMSNKVVQTVIGALLILGGLVGWYVLPDRGEIAMLALVGFGGFLVSQRTAAAAIKALADAFSKWRKG